MEREKAMTIFYEVGNNLYLNLTNRCSCACTFCIRTMGNGVYGSDPLWLEHEPTQAEIFAALEQVDFTLYKEVMFCGFGEPTERLEVLKETAQWLRQHGVGSIRLNTNGLVDLHYGRSTASELEGLVDTVSISLNAGTKQAYLDVTRPKFGEVAFDAMQKYALDCKAYVPQVMLTVVDILPPDEMAAAKQLAQRLGITLRVRKFDNAATRREKE
ncbi:MAG: TIGR04100 family radical SAM protein [Ruminococcus sp.]|nr:TIGR04100 family radical SAM protein [Ruminococcus sp.]